MLRGLKNKIECKLSLQTSSCQISKSLSLFHELQMLFYCWQKSDMLIIENKCFKEVETEMNIQIRPLANVLQTTPVFVRWRRNFYVIYHCSWNKIAFFSPQCSFKIHFLELNEIVSIKQTSQESCVTSEVSQFLAKVSNCSNAHSLMRWEKSKELQLAKNFYIKAA